MKSNNIFLIILVALFILICCLCIVMVASGIFLIANSDSSSSSSDSIFSDENENPPIEIFPFGNNNTDDNPNDSGLVPSIISPNLNQAHETLNTLKNTYIPENDPHDLARRLKGIEFIPETVPNNTNYQIGDKKDFWVTNVDTNENRKVNAKLGFKTDNVYFWIEDNVSYDRNELENLVTTFEDDILPINREFFGTEWIPGIDENERLFILYATSLGSSLAGYFSSADALPPQVHEFSNSHEMFMLNADTIRLSQKFTYGVLAHEYQHMIHWYQDRNETSWLNEGFSELAAFLNGYYESGFDTIFMADTDIQLNDWPNTSFNTTPHYGASFLFVNYFLNRFGDDATKALVKNPNNGLDSIDKVLTEINAIDDLSGEIFTADDIFKDWIITNFVMDERVNDGRYYYENYTNSPKAAITEKVDECEFNWKERSVSQYGADYIELKCDRDFNLQFQGITTTQVIPESAFSGDFAFWSNKGDESNMTLSQTFDFSEIQQPISMSFMMWYDIESDYDYLYLTASTDGENWQILETPSCVKNNPTGNSFGCGFNGKSDGWVKENVDLSLFSGETVELRFEYVTDAAVYGEGFLLDDIQIPVIDYFSDFEFDNGGWSEEGWARIHNQLPQTYRVILLEYKSGKVNINEIELSDLQNAEIQINGKTNNKTILIVSGTTRYTRQPAYYKIQSTQH
ncbi:MAG: immune inhibitor A [Anaerolineaceae bacterium]|nr:immune inhibitor A [Anaerolineaceae bacterium]